MKKFLSAVFLLFTALAFGQNIQPRPVPPKLVNDFAHILSASDKQALEDKLVAFDNSTSNQIAVIIVPTLDGYPLEDLSLKYLRDWGIGNKKTNNGAVLFVAVQEHKLRIETGYGLEGALPDLTCLSIIDNDLTPQFKAGNYAGGIDAATNSMMQATKGEYTAPAGYQNRGNGGATSGIPEWVIFLGIALLLLFFLSRGGGGTGGSMMSRRGYTGLNNPLLWMLMGGGGNGGGGGGGGGFGGGGFGGFGGGSGGGGGASGGW